MLTSRPLANPRPAALSLNVEGVSATAILRVELIDKNGTPIPGYSGAAAASVKESGLKTKISWPGGELIRCANPLYRVRLTFSGPDSARIKFYAGYLE